MLLAFAGLKGGTGRTTTAVAIACESVLRGRRTLLLDADPREDALAWASAATCAPTTLACGPKWDAETVSAVARGFDLVCLDLPADPERTAELAPAADLVLAPCGPSAVEVWGVIDTARLLAGVRVRVLITRTSGRGRLAEALETDLRASELCVCATKLGRRSVHEEAMSVHTSAPEYAPGSVAALEVAALLDELDGIRPAHVAGVWAQ
jgi:chromosome partitioning protein